MALSSDVTTDLMVDTPADPLAGTNYAFISELGRGGMGVVYSAEHRQLGHLVAVKVLRTDQDKSETAQMQSRDRQRIEGEIGARLRHENLVQVHDFDVTASGHPCLVMELLEGRTLYERLVEEALGPLPLAEALDVTCQALSGLQAVHDAGLIHRDIKPDNIFICDDGTVKLLDLGCAKVLSQAAAVTPRSLAIPTATHIFVGSPRYMAPEQAQLSKTADERLDIYAMGCVLYRLLTGRGPFDEARTFGEIQHAHCHQLPTAPSRHLHEPLPDGLDELLLRLLSKSPDDRPSSASTVAAELRRMELQARKALGSDYITDTLRPPTTMAESSRMWQPPPPTPSPPEIPPGYVSTRQLALALTAFLVLGMMLGVLIVRLRGGVG